MGSGACHRESYMCWAPLQPTWLRNMVMRSLLTWKNLAQHGGDCVLCFLSLHPHQGLQSSSSLGRKGRCPFEGKHPARFWHLLASVTMVHPAHPSNPIHHALHVCMYPCPRDFKIDLHGSFCAGASMCSSKTPSFLWLLTPSLNNPATSAVSCCCGARRSPALAGKTHSCTH